MADSIDQPSAPLRCKFMKTYSPSLVLILLAFLLAACGANATPTSELALDNIYTAAAATLSAQEGLATSTPPATSTRFATSTPFNFLTPTLVKATSTNQSLASYSPAATANGCNDAIFISDVTIADGTVLAPGESFTKTWEFQNTGSCDWNENYLLTFVSGTDMDGATTEIDQEVEASTTVELSVSLIAPDSEGTYTGYWRLAAEDGNLFGQSVYVMIVVSDEAAILTPTSTLMPTSTTEIIATETLTSTPAPTSVPTETLTPTLIPTETLTPVTSQ
jgi:Ig-like domain-containing protein